MANPTSYIIQFVNPNQNPPAPVNYCIGVNSGVQNAPVFLSLLQGAGSPNTQWILDPNAGSIILASTYGSPMPLYLTIPGTAPVQSAQLILAPFVLGSVLQSWNWLGAGQRITSNAPPGTFCVDNNACNLTANNPIIIYPNSGKCQTWQFVPVPAMMAALDASAQSVGEAKQPRLNV